MNSTQTTSNFANAMCASARTWNGAVSYSTPDPISESNGRVALFFKGCRGLNIPQLHIYLRDAAHENLLDAFLLAFQLRDCRGGKGERELGRRSLQWLLVNYPVQFRKVLHLLPEYGRWDDLLQFFPKSMLLINAKTVSENYGVTRLSEDELHNLRTIQFDAVGLMATQLLKDRAAMLDGKPCSIAAKWSPTEGSSLDKKYGVYKTLAIAMRVKPRSLRTDFNTPLRQYLKVVECFMCSQRWDKVDFNKVPSQAMRRLKKAFEKHDPVRFAEWRAKLGEADRIALKDPKVAKVNAKVLHPHELVKEMRMNQHQDAVTEAQWQVLVDELRNDVGNGLQGMIVVSDVSGSMECPDNLPMDVSIAMGSLVSQVVTGSFHNHVITFHTNPSFTVLKDGHSAFERYQTIRHMTWGGSTNLQKTFELILARGRACNLKQEDMPSKLLIVSDMQFDQCAHLTNMEAIDAQYQTSGYTRPQIVFWNVNGASTDFPVTIGTHGTALISGFSPSIIKTLLGGDDLNVMSILRSTLDDVRYHPIRDAINAIEDPNVVGILHTTIDDIRHHPVREANVQVVAESAVAEEIPDLVDTPLLDDFEMIDSDFQ